MQPIAAFLAKVTPPQTPALVVRRTSLLANLAAMQAACDVAGVRLRAHGKMHKCSTLGRLQVAGGAIGLCCQTVGEAECYAAAGVADLLVTAPVPGWGWPRLAALAGATRITAVVDSSAQVAWAAAAARATAAEIGIMVDIDLGLHRAGAAAGDAGALAAAVRAAPGLRFDGVQGYCGHLQHVTNRDQRALSNAAASAVLADVVKALAAAGMPPPQVSGGGTGTFALDLAGGVYTELQAGSYAFMDVEYGDCDGPDGDWPFVPALFIAATVVSAQHRSHVTCDAGLKAIHSDGPKPRVLVPAGAAWRSFGDEHGAIVGGTAQEGDRIWLQPGHVDPTVVLHDALWVADEEGRIERWAIDARRTS